MNLDFAAVMAWLRILPQVVQAGVGVFAQIKGVLQDNGVDADTAELDRVIADAEARRQRAEAEAGQ